MNLDKRNELSIKKMWIIMVVKLNKIQDGGVAMIKSKKIFEKKYSARGVLLFSRKSHCLYIFVLS